VQIHIEITLFVIILIIWMQTAKCSAKCWILGAVGRKNSHHTIVKA